VNGRSNRRWKEEVIVKRRLKSLSYRSGYWNFHDANDDKVDSPSWKDFIGRPENFMFKTYTTDSRDSEYKVKYSANRNKGYYRDGGKKGTREREKQNFLNILDEYELRSVNSGQFGQMGYTEWLSICEQICKNSSCILEGRWCSCLPRQQDSEGGSEGHEESTG
jgi:hypothetical protein